MDEGVQCKLHGNEVLIPCLKQGVLCVEAVEVWSEVHRPMMEVQNLLVKTDPLLV
jgi:hypothetical protein